MLISEKSSSELVKLNENLNNLNLLTVFLYVSFYRLFRDQLFPKLSEKRKK